MKALNNTINQYYLNDIYRTLHSRTPHSHSPNYASLPKMYMV